MEIREYTVFRPEEVLPLYAAAGWTRYTERPGMLAEAFAHSLCVLVAWDGERLTGLIRAVGDGASVLYIQDLLVLPECRRQGVGTALVQALLRRYAAVCQTVLLTDDTAEAKAFYRAAGFVPAKEWDCLAFVRM